MIVVAEQRFPCQYVKIAWWFGFYITGNHSNQMNLIKVCKWYSQNKMWIKVPCILWLTYRSDKQHGKYSLWRCSRKCPFNYFKHELLLIFPLLEQFKNSTVQIAHCSLLPEFAAALLLICSLPCCFLSHAQISASAVTENVMTDHMKLNLDNASAFDTVGNSPSSTLLLAFVLSKCLRQTPKLS